MSETGTDVIRYADAAMYDSQPILKEEGARVTPRVFLLNGTSDPLGKLAVDMRMYRGDPVYNQSDITDEERHWAWRELSKTRLNTPLEGITVKFMIEGVTRSFTHQLVRQRVGAFYVQESLRFAVKRGIRDETAMPITVQGDEVAEKIWDDVVDKIGWGYNALVDHGIPAEDARGLLPHNITTRVLYDTNLRALFEHAGNRLCTQAQFEWRAVFMGMMRAMKEFDGNEYWFPIEQRSERDANRRWKSDDWQWDIIATPRPMTFAPVCYKTGKCEFMSELDRGCSIRERVNTFHSLGVPPSEWVHDHPGEMIPVKGIDPEEWMADPLAGVTTKDNRPS